MDLRGRPIIKRKMRTTLVVKPHRLLKGRPRLGFRGEETIEKKLPFQDAIDPLGQGVLVRVAHRRHRHAGLEQVVRLNGQPITLWVAFERLGGYAAGVATGLLGFFQIFWDPNRQGIHDRIAGTAVIRTKK